MSSSIHRLEAWYASQCDGDWEHRLGVNIDTLDNPGWHVRIDLADTELASKNFERVEIERSARDWVVCYREGSIFHGVGGAKNLDDILETFLEWIAC